MPREHDLIAGVFARFAAQEGAFDLRDDAARLDGWTITVDQIIEGVHFRTEDPIETIARKLVRRNVSDLIAKGAQPRHGLLSLAWPETRPVVQLEAFGTALGEDLAGYGADLLGGDTAKSPEHLSASLTLIGHAPRFVPRAGLTLGEPVFVTGVIGDAGLGLIAAQGGLEALSAAHRQALIAAYQTPAPPPAAFSGLIQRYANASIDVSDGLLLDASRLSSTQHDASVDIDLARLLLSDPATAWVDQQNAPHAARRHLATLGDDYQCLFSVSEADVAAMQAEAQALDVQVTQIGAVVEGTRLQEPAQGFSHDFGQSV